MKVPVSVRIECPSCGSRGFFVLPTKHGYVIECLVCNRQEELETT